MGKILWKSLLQVVVSVETFYEWFLLQVVWSGGQGRGPALGQSARGQPGGRPRPRDVDEEAPGPKGGKALPRQEAAGRRVLRC